jgi:hypothetical protein
MSTNTTTVLMYHRHETLDGVTAGLVCLYWQNNISRPLFRMTIQRGNATCNVCNHWILLMTVNSARFSGSDKLRLV